VQAPISYGFGGFAWFNIDLTSGVPNANIQQVVQAQRLLTSFIEEVIEAYQPDTNRIFLAGFSQGAIMSYATAFVVPEKVTGVVAMSGYILKDTAPQIFTPALKNLRILATHGIYDQVLPIFLGRASEAFLKSMQLNHIYKEYPMAHEVNYECFNDVKTWLSQQIKL
jgi:phospholipase/carboxylesterase